MVDTRELFNRLKRELDKRRKEREREEEDEMSMTDDSSSTSSDEASSPDIKKPQRKSSAARRKKARRGSSRSSRKIIESESSPLSLMLYSSMQLPTACLHEHDGCDEAELIARANRCKEILRLSNEAREAEDARAKAAKNKKSLVWAKPTFELDPAQQPTPDTTSTKDAYTCNLG